MLNFIYLFLTVSYFVFAYFWTKEDPFNFLIKILLSSVCLIGGLSKIYSLYIQTININDSFNYKYFLFTIVWNTILLLGFFGTENVPYNKRAQLLAFFALNVLFGLIGFLLYA